MKKKARDVGGEVVKYCYLIIVALETNLNVISSMGQRVCRLSKQGGRIGISHKQTR